MATQFRRRLKFGIWETEWDDELEQEYARLIETFNNYQEAVDALNAYWDPDGFYVSSYYDWEEVKA